MPRRIIIAILLIIIGTISIIIAAEIGFKRIYWEILVPPIFYIVSGILIFKGKLIGHFVAIPVLAYSLFRSTNYFVNTFFHSNETYNLWQILRFDLPNISIFILAIITIFLLVRDLIKIKTSTDYNLKVAKLNEPELWLYPWLITLISLYLLRIFDGDVEIAVFIITLLPITYFIFLYTSVFKKE